MTKRFCDYCKKEIAGDAFRVLDMGDADGNVWYVCDQLQDIEISIDHDEICVDCARKIKNFTETLVKEFLYA